MRDTAFDSVPSRAEVVRHCKTTLIELSALCSFGGLKSESDYLRASVRACFIDDPEPRQGAPAALAAPPPRVRT